MTADAFAALLNEELERDALRAEKIREAIALCDKVTDCGVLYLLERCLDGEQAAQSHAAAVVAEEKRWGDVYDDDEWGTADEDERYRVLSDDDLCHPVRPGRKPKAQAEGGESN